MLRALPILCSACGRLLVLAAVAVTLAACGQKGDLYLPKEPAAAGRSTLPETLRPGGITVPAPMSPASAPASPPASTSAPAAPR